LKLVEFTACLKKTPPNLKSVEYTAGVQKTREAWILTILLDLRRLEKLEVIRVYCWSSEDPKSLNTEYTAW